MHASFLMNVIVFKASYRVAYARFIQLAVTVFNRPYAERRALQLQFKGTGTAIPFLCLVAAAV
jgi:hypothetical protein